MHVVGAHLKRRRGGALSHACPHCGCSVRLTVSNETKMLTLSPLSSPPLPPQIFSLVVFASIVNEGYVNIGSERLYCVFNKNADACNYGVFVGLVGLLACSFFGLLDYKFSSISSIKDRKKAVMLEIGFSGEEDSRPV